MQTVAKDRREVCGRTPWETILITGSSESRLGKTNRSGERTDDFFVVWICVRVDEDNLEGAITICSQVLLDLTQVWKGSSVICL